MFATRVAFIADSKICFALLRLTVPTLPHEGHLAVSGNDLKNIFNCKTNLV